MEPELVEYWQIQAGEKFEYLGRIFQRTGFKNEAVELKTDEYVQFEYGVKVKRIEG
jgi:hypothetical protein